MIKCPGLEIQALDIKYPLLSYHILPVFINIFYFVDNRFLWYNSLV